MHREVAFGQEFLHVAIAERKPQAQPDGTPDDLGRELMTVIRDGLRPLPYCATARPVSIDVTRPWDDRRVAEGSLWILRRREPTGRRSGYPERSAPEPNGVFPPRSFEEGGDCIGFRVDFDERNIPDSDCAWPLVLNCCPTIPYALRNLGLEQELLPKTRERSTSQERDPAKRARGLCNG
jgi:hypothetical protein